MLNSVFSNQPVHPLSPGRFHRFKTLKQGMPRHELVFQLVEIPPAFVLPIFCRVVNSLCIRRPSACNDHRVESMMPMVAAILFKTSFSGFLVRLLFLGGKLIPFLIRECRDWLVQNLIQLPSVAIARGYLTVGHEELLRWNVAFFICRVASVFALPFHINQAKPPNHF